MMNTNWLRFGILGTLVFAGGAAGLIACSDDGGGDNNDNDAGSSSGGEQSSSSGENTSGGSSGENTSSSSGGSSSGEVPEPKKAAVFVAHGFNEIGPVRICFAASEEAPPATDATPRPVPPLPAAGAGAQPNPPLLPGTGGFLPDLGNDLAELHIQPYIVREASRLAALAADPQATTCDKLIGAGKPLVAGTDYYVLPPIPKGKLANEKTFVLVAVNGSDDPPADPPVGANVGVIIKEVDRATEIAADKAGLQFLNGSKYIAAGVTPFLYRGASVDPSKEWYAGEEKVLADTLLPAAAVAVEAINATTNGHGIKANLGEGENDYFHEREGSLIPVKNWSDLSDSAGIQKDDEDNSLYFQSGRSFTFIFLGNPAAGPINPATGDFKGPHFLVIPNDPVIPAP